MQLLDIAWPGRDHHPIIDKPIPLNHPDSIPTKTVDSLSVPEQILDTLGVDSTVIDTLRSHLNFLTGSDGGSSTAMWGIFFTAVAIGLCLYFAWTYRRQNTRKLYA
jgi:hypothetical protein